MRHHSFTTADLLVVGAGLAGLYAALNAADQGASVTLVTKGSLRASNSFMAQGGVAAALADGDSPDAHAEDTIRVGHGLCDPRAVHVLVHEGVTRIADLERYGVQFDRRPDGRYAFGREGGHRRHRILHAGGAATGAAIAEALLGQVAIRPAITIMQHTAVLELRCGHGRCSGAWVLGHDELVAVDAQMTLLATGGAGALFARSTNPSGATGDGIAIAARAGADLTDMEFVQFHPTALDAGSGRAFLISEAVRGEGARLVGAGGERIMEGVHPDGELAPRDVVARVIHERRTAGLTSYLDLRHLDPDRIQRRFPTLIEGCAANGVDLANDLVPVAPAAHYLMGGVATNLDGATSIHGLYASGECAATGVHGANRLASNSLLECFVFSHRAVAAGLAGPHPGPVDDGPPERPMQRAPLGELRRRMWRDAGLIRNERGLSRLIDWLDGQRASNPVVVARAIAASALARRESRGAHQRSDHQSEHPEFCRRMPSPAPVLR